MNVSASTASRNGARRRSGEQRFGFAGDERYDTRALRPPRHRLRARRAEGRDPGGEARAARRDRRAAQSSAGSRQPRDDPLEDAARGGRLPHRASQRAMYGESYRVKEEITIEDLALRTQPGRRAGDRHRPRPARAQPRPRPQRNRALRRPPHAWRSRAARSGSSLRRRSSSRPARGRTARDAVEFDEKTILDSDGLLLLDRMPASMVVVGAGIIGIEYASMFAALGSKVTVVEKRHRLLDFVDAQIAEGLQYHLRDLGVVFRFGETVTAVERHGDGALTHARERQADRGRRRPLRRRATGRDRTSWTSSRPASRPTSAAGSRSTRTSDRRRRTSTPRAT